MYFIVMLLFLYLYNLLKKKELYFLNEVCYYKVLVKRGGVGGYSKN